MASLRSKNETVVLRMIYNFFTHLNVPKTSAAYGGTGSSVKRSENRSHHIRHERHTTTTVDIYVSSSLTCICVVGGRVFCLSHIQCVIYIYILAPQYDFTPTVTSYHCLCVFTIMTENCQETVKKLPHLTHYHYR